MPADFLQLVALGLKTSFFFLQTIEIGVEFGLHVGAGGAAIASVEDRLGEVDDSDLGGGLGGGYRNYQG